MGHPIYRLPFAVTGSNLDDLVTGNHYLSISTGRGDDLVDTSHSLFVNTGDGDDTVLASHAHRVWAGYGDDLVGVKDAYEVNAGNGDDMVYAEDCHMVTGGAGDDQITAVHSRYVSGGKGDDIINIIGSHSTVCYRLGDGNDEINADGDLRLRLQDVDGLDDVDVSQDGDTFTISLKGTGEKIVINMPPGAELKLEFMPGTISFPHEAQAVQPTGDESDAVDTTAEDDPVSASEDTTGQDAVDTADASAATQDAGNSQGDENSVDGATANSRDMFETLTEAFRSRVEDAYKNKAEADLVNNRDLWESHHDHRHVSHRARRMSHMHHMR